MKSWIVRLLSVAALAALGGCASLFRGIGGH